MEQLLVTTVRTPDAAVSAGAQRFARQWQGRYVPRGDLSLDALRAEGQVDRLVVFSAQGPCLDGGDWRFFHHPSMAALRGHAWLRGDGDALVTALQLQAGDCVLDCTLGLGADAIMASLAVGESGRVRALESSPWVAMISAYGLAHPQAQEERLAAAMRRIEVQVGQAADILREMAPGAVDVIYFDPMFRSTVAASSNMQPLRQIADLQPLTPALLQQARRVARRRVVVKEAAGSPEWRRLGITQFSGGRYSRIRYGILEGSGA